MTTPYQDGYNAYHLGVPMDFTKPREWRRGWMDASRAKWVHEGIR